MTYTCFNLLKIHFLSKSFRNFGKIKMHINHRSFSTFLTSPLLVNKLLWICGMTPPPAMVAFTN